MRLVSTLGFVLAFACAPVAGAAIFVVNSTTDAPDAALNNGICAAAGGACTLRAAIQEANQNVSADTIQVPAGTFTLTIAGDDADAAQGDLDIRQPVAIEGAGADATIIDAAGLDRVFEIPFVTGTPAVSIEALTIQGGAITDDAGAGILHSDDGTLLLNSVTIFDNHVTGVTSGAIGGGISVLGGSNVTILDSLIVGNSAERGGAIFTNSTVTLEVSTIAGNVARTGAAFESYGSTTIERSTISANEATNGAIVDVADDDLTFRNSTASGNDTVGQLFLLSGGDSLVIERSTLFDNATNGTIRAITGTLEVTGTVLAGSLGVEECDADVLALLDYNLDDDGSCGVPSSTSITAADPKLGPLANNGGATLTRAPRFGSPLIDAAETAPTCAGVDQRGLPRPVDAGGDPTARCDIGAVELAPEPASAGLALASFAALALLTRRRRT